MIAHVVYSFWAVAFVLGLLSQDAWFSLGMGYLISNIVVWPSDHSQDPLPIAIYFHIWWTLATLVGAWTGVLAASATSMPRLLYTEQLIGSRWTPRTAWTKVMLLSVVAVSAGVNFVTCRACVGGSGMSPMGLSDTASHVLGGLLVALGAILLIASVVMLWRGDWRGAMAIKYYFPMVIIPSGLLFLHDYFAITNPIGNWEPGVIYLGTLVIAGALLWLWVYYVPGAGESGAFDEFHRRSMNTTILVLLFTATLFFGALAVFIPIWVLNYFALLEALISLSAVSLAIIIIFCVLSYMSQDGDNNWSVMKRYQPVPVSQETEMDFSDGVIEVMPQARSRNKSGKVLADYI